ncbi:hypothetical protein RE6C_05901 [Rhodopirellula europaea 6C]|uniref:Uncharacterized protein n=1 Tax=Rhodopirellula europaea 6C TaxID=1263867 RepID=M2AV54_9BACT|nr:hypothetical protein RE6C_05901 [Rhodopirellula europaea 6C]
MKTWMLSSFHLRFIGLPLSQAEGNKAIQIDPDDSNSQSTP